MITAKLAERWAGVYESSGKNTLCTRNGHADSYIGLLVIHYAYDLFLDNGGFS